MSAVGSNSPFAAPGLWDSIKIGGQLWRGKVDVRAAKRVNKYQSKDAPGIEGETTTYRGRRGEHFDITFYIHTEALWTQWNLFSQQFFNVSGAKGLSALSIDYPSLAVLGITQILVVEVGAVDPIGEDGMYAAKVKVKEYLPVVPIDVTKTPIAGPAVPFIPVTPTAAQAAAQHLQANKQMGYVLGDLKGLPF
jgi:hypothetical protein